MTPSWVLNCTARHCPTGGSSDLLFATRKSVKHTCHHNIFTMLTIKLIKTKAQKTLPQNQIHNNQLRRAEQENQCLQKCVQTLTTQNKDLHVQLQEIKRKQAEIECKVQ